MSRRRKHASLLRTHTLATLLFSPTSDTAPTRGAPGLTPDQLTRRQLGVGASEAGAVLGLDPYRTGYAVWLNKTGQAVCSGGAPSIAAQRGQYLEPLVAELYAARFPGVTLTQGTTLAHPDHPCILATPDFFVEGDGEARLVECKSKLRRTAKGFGEEGTDEVPDSIQLQVQQQMLVTGLSRCDVAVLIDDEFRVYPVQANPAIQQVLLDVTPGDAARASVDRGALQRLSAYPNNRATVTSRASYANNFALARTNSSKLSSPFW